MFDYLTDPRDKAVCGLTPTLMAPRFGQLADPAVGLHRYVIAANGLFLQARTHALSVCLKVATVEGLPYGVVSEHVRLARGSLPRAIYDEIQRKAVLASPNEWAGVVVFDPVNQSYRLIEPQENSVSPSHITYTTSGYDPEYVVLDVHSHGDGRAFFSTTDNTSDQHGVYLASVLGHCDDVASVEVVTRIVVNGQFFAVPWTPWD